MNDLEERLRAVTRAAAEQIPADRLPPMSVPAPGRFRRLLPGLGRFRTTRTTRWARRPGGLAPLAAAAAVVALVAGSLTVAHVARQARTAGRGQAAAAPPSLPPYYVSLLYSNTLGYAQPGSLAVSATATGGQLTSVTPPSGAEFTGVSGAADDLTFVASAETPAQVRNRLRHAQRAQGLAAAALPARFYLVRFDPATSTARVTSLPIPALPDVTDFAISPDGSSLAVARANGNTITVSVYSVATGAARSWTAATHRGGQNLLLAEGLSWTQDAALGFDVLPANKHALGPFGLLNTATTGGSLLADSTMFPAGPCSPGMFAADGSLIIASVTSPGNQLPWTLRECSVSHGRATVTVPSRTLYVGKTPVDFEGPFWVSPDGGTIVVTGAAGQPWSDGVTGVMTGNQIKPLPGSATLPQSGAFPGAVAAW
jgi:hypothetical protein